MNALLEVEYTVAVVFMLKSDAFLLANSGESIYVWRSHLERVQMTWDIVRSKNQRSVHWSQCIRTRHAGCPKTAIGQYGSTESKNGKRVDCPKLNMPNAKACRANSYRNGSIRFVRTKSHNRMAGANNRLFNLPLLFQYVFKPIIVRPLGKWNLYSIAASYSNGRIHHKRYGWLYVFCLELAKTLTEAIAICWV